MIKLNSNQNRIILFSSPLPFFLNKFEIINFEKNDKIINKKVEYLFTKFILILILMFYPFYLIFSKIKNIRFSKIKLKKFRLIQPMLFGFKKLYSNLDQSNKNEKFTTRLIKDDTYLYSKYFNKGDILHLYDYKWPFTNQEIKMNNNYMEYHNIPYFDSKKYCLNYLTIIKTIKVNYYFFSQTIKNILNLHFKELLIILKTNKIYILKHIQLANIDFKFEFFRDDYNPRSTLESIINMKYNKKSIAVQHHIHPVAYPPIAFVHFDKYIVFSELVYSFGMKYWKNMKIVKTGRENLDNLYNIYMNKEKIKNDFTKKYKNNSSILIILPTKIREYVDDSIFQNLIDALNKFTKIKNLKINIFLKLRGDCTSNFNSKLINICKKDNRLIFESNYSSHELLILCDFVISHSASFTIWESAAIKAKIFVLDTSCFLNNYYFKGIKKTFFISQTEQIIDLLTMQKINYNYYKDSWETLYRKANYYFDGNNLERYQRAVNE